MTRKLVPKGRGDIFEWTQKKLPPYLTREEVRQVLKGVEQNRFHHLLINFLWQTGARVTEALSVKVSDIDFYSKVVRMPSLKKREPQIKTIPLKGDLLGELGAYVGQEGLKKEEQLKNLRKNKMEVRESFSHVPDIQAKILRNLEEQERLLLARIREKREKQG